MGSLMAGWDSPTLDPESGFTFKLTSLQISPLQKFEYRRTTNIFMDTEQTPKLEDSENCGVSITVGLNRKKEPLDMDVDENSLKKFVKKNCWWTKSSWAFLNEPPVIEASSNNYGSQFHVANFRSTKFKTAN
ncbi:hypothetical protein PHAVU_009G058800 [Phaseolus vulgaris]|uniref:Uncharacterized protein n=1 Tax=Phaseolus vulgaris TaxID=3885 RepID=V7ASF8_PHAVU|nr:hypothetical protein PHAVU_009G058800g [Phaseolus vulgaris]ESW08597.1 hypothetical protein PHAVU_009G058800g [Phaseolus vulgaris]